MREAARRGANEVLAWVAAFGAFSTGGHFTVEQEFYEAIPGWIAGMAMMAAKTSRRYSLMNSSIGAGSTGSTTALAFANSGVRCHIVSRGNWMADSASPPPLSYSSLNR